MKTELLDEFERVFGNASGANVYFAPGRVNLIGEYTDFNGGMVFPCALTIGTYGVVKKRKDRRLRFYSANFGQIGLMESDLDSLLFNKGAGWTNYPKGVIWTFLEKGYDISTGMDLYLKGNIPNASGLSSSASVEVLTGFILNDLFGLKISNVDLALYGQYAENHYIGVHCGIMDQFSIAMGKKNHAVFLDTGNLSYTYAPLALKDVSMVIVCSNKKRSLEDSKYNERRSECESALNHLRTVLSIENLCELDCAQFDANRHVIPCEVSARRAKHAIYENQRTIQAVEALKRGELSVFGRLMKESHISLRDDFEVTGVELDTLYDLAISQDGVIGARMTGAGFGGCTVNLVKTDAVEQFIRTVSEGYLKKIGYQADFYLVKAGDGPRRL